MARRGVPAGWESSAHRPSTLEITVESAPRRGSTVARAQVLIAIAVLGVMAAAIAVAALPGGGGGSAPPPSPAPQMPAPEQPPVLVQSLSPSPQGGNVIAVLRPVGGSRRSVTPVLRAGA